jgi:hypothetical protein
VAVDELLRNVTALMDYIQANAATLNMETQRELGLLLQESMQAINEYQQRPPITERPIEATIPEGTGLLWNLAGGEPKAFTNYLKNVPDPSLNGLLNNPTQLNQIIARLQENQPQQRNREIEGVPQAPLQSSNIWGFSYDQKNRKLFVRFQGDGVYEYEGVPPNIFTIFRSGAVPAKTQGQNNYGSWWVGKNPSLGASFYELIRQGGYPFQKLS